MCSSHVKSSLQNPIAIPNLVMAKDIARHLVVLDLFVYASLDSRDYSAKQEVSVILKGIEALFDYMYMKKLMFLL